MKVAWFVRTLLLLIAVGLAGNIFGGQMASATPLQPGPVSAAQASLTVQAFMANEKANDPGCRHGFPAGVAGNGAFGLCGVGLAVLPESGLPLARPIMTASNRSIAASLMTPRTPAPLIRPPRA